MHGTNNIKMCILLQRVSSMCIPKFGESFYFGDTKIIRKGCWSPAHYILNAHPERNSYKNLFERP